MATTESVCEVCGREKAADAWGDGCYREMPTVVEGSTKAFAVDCYARGYARERARAHAAETLMGEAVRGEAYARAALDAADKALKEEGAQATELQDWRDAWAAAFGGATADPHKSLRAVANEMERLRHGVTEMVEGDFVCPDSLALSETKKAHAKTLEEVARLRQRAQNARALLDPNDPRNSYSALACEVLDAALGSAK